MGRYRDNLQQIKDLNWFKIGFLAILLAALYYSALKYLLHLWKNEDNSYCIMIPFVVLYLVWEKGKELNSSPSMRSWGGFVPFLAGVVFFWVGELGGEYSTLYISLWFVIIGLLWMHVGWQKIKSIGFALVMMLAMFPFPQFLIVKISFGLKLISSDIGVRMLHLYGMSAYREGNVIDLGFTQLQVVDACSGLRYLFPLMIMGILFAYFYRAAIWKRLVLVLSTIPLTIVINSLRIALTGIIYTHWGAAAAEGFFHGFSGWLIFIVSLAVLLVEIWVLRRIAPGPTESFFAKPGAKQPLRVGIKASNYPFHALHKTGNIGKRRVALFGPHFVVAAVLLLLTLGISAGVEFREKIPASKPFSQFPLTVGAWEGTRQYMEQVFIKELDLSDYTMIDFKGGGGKHVDFYVAYYESQRKGESIHSPETCLPGSGWEFREAGAVIIPIAKGNTPNMKVNRAIMAKPGMKQIVYFWFPQRGRVLTNAYEMKIYTFWDALTRQRTDGALVRLITPVLQGEKVEDAEKRLQEFTKQIVPILDEFIPK